MALLLRFWFVLHLCLFISGLASAKLAPSPGMSTAPAVTDITISGFSELLFNNFPVLPNGVYTPDQPINNAPHWTRPILADIAYSIQWSGIRWEIFLSSPTTTLLLAYNYSGTSTAPPCTRWLTPSTNITTPPTLAGGCVSITPPAGVSSVTMDGFVGLNTDFNGTYTWAGTLNGANIWAKMVSPIVGNTPLGFDIQAFVQWSGTRWEVFGDKASVLNQPFGSTLSNALSDFAGIVAYNTSCPQSSTALPCGGWEASAGYPLATSGYSGVAAAVGTSVASTAETLTFVSPFSPLIAPPISLSLNGDANGAPRWVGQSSNSIYTGEVELIWLNATISSQPATWALRPTEANLAAIPVLYNTGGSTLAIPINGWISPTVGTSIPYSLTILPPRIVTQPTCQTTLSACVNTPFRLALEVANVTSFRWFRGTTALTGQTSATLSLANVQASDAGVYSLSATSPYGSVVSNLFILTVQPTNPSLTSGTLTCTLRTVNLSATATSGASYTLLGGNGGPSISATGQFTANQTGSYTVVVASSEGCTATATATVTQNLTLPSFAVSNGSACAGGVASLSASGCSGGTILWPGGLVGSTFSTSLSGPVTATCTLGICSTTASGSVTINQITPTLQASSPTFCSGSQVVLTAGGGSTYFFSGPGLSQNGSSTTVIASQGGTYSVLVTTVTNCTAVTSVSLSQLPSPNALLVGTGNLSCTTPTLTLTAVGGTNYQFSGPASGIVSQTNGRERVVIGDYVIFRTPIPTVGQAVISKPGTYNALVTDANGCSATATIVVTGTECR